MNGADTKGRDHDADPWGLEIRLLGGFSMAVAGHPVSLPARKDRGLLALLVLAGGRPVRRRALLDALWPDGAAADPGFYLRRSLVNLRKALGAEAGRVESAERDQVRFNLTGAFVDVLAFDADAASDDPLRWRQALRLYAGPLLPDFPDLWTLPARQARHSVFLERSEHLAEALLASRDLPGVAEIVAAALRIEPDWEAGIRLRMRELEARGRAHDAVETYQTFTERLRRDDPRRGPDPVTTALAATIRDRSLRADAAPGLMIAGNLPVPLTDLVGRDDALARLVGTLASRRLVTLTGPGGSGKTRLALEAASRRRDACPDGVWWVDLTPLADPELVVPAVASVLSVHPESGEDLVATLVDRLRGRRLLLVIDNCEQVLDAAAHLVRRMLESCAEIRVLATSREALGIVGEVVVPVPPLAVPPAAFGGSVDALLAFDAVRLFVDRVRALVPDFDPEAAGLESVAAVCRRLDGIPLALELAAARMHGMTIREIEDGLGDRFTLLKAGARTAPSRHQTLSALIDSSFDLLDPARQVLLRRLGVFVGGWDREAAEAVCGDPDLHEGLRELVARNLVVAEPTGGRTRYRMLEMIREYALRRLEESGEAKEVRDRHLRHFRALAETSRQWLCDDAVEQPLGLARLDAEIDNFRAALDHAEASENGAEDGLRLVSALRRYWDLRWLGQEGRRRLSTAMARPLPSVSPAVRAHALLGLATLPGGREGLEVGRLLEESGSLFQQAGDSDMYLEALWRLAVHVYFERRANAAEALCLEGLALARGIGAVHHIHMNLYLLSQFSLLRGDIGAAREWMAQARHEPPWQENRWLEAVEAGLRHEEGDPAWALPRLREALQQDEVRQDRHNRTGLRIQIGRALTDVGELDEAAALLSEAFELSKGSDWFLALSLDVWVRWARIAERYEEAAAFLGAADRAWGGAEKRFPLYAARADRESALLRDVLGEAAFDAAREAGRALPPEDVPTRVRRIVAERAISPGAVGPTA